MRSLFLGAALALVALILLFVSSGAAQEPSRPKFDVAAFLKTVRDEPAIEVETVRTIALPKNAGLLEFCFSQDMSRLAAAYDSNNIIVWDLATGKQVSPANYKCPGRISAIALSADGKQLLIGREKGNGLLVECDVTKVITKFEGLTDRVKSARLSPDGKHAIFGQNNGEIFRFLLAGGKPDYVPRLDQEEHPDDIVYISRDGQAALVGGGFKKRLSFVKLPDGPTAGAATNVEREYHVRAAEISSKYVIYNDSSRLFFHSRPDAMDGYVWQRFPSRVSWMGLSSDERRLICVSHDGIIEVRDMIAPGIEQLIPLNQDLLSCEIGTDGRTFAVFDESRQLIVRRLPANVDAPRLRLSRTLQQLLGAKDYEGLEAIFLHFEKDLTPFSWAPNCTPYKDLCTILATPPGAPMKTAKISEAIAAWHAARPHATAPQLLLAQEQIRLGWQKRGGGVAATVTPEGWKGFYEHLGAAEKLIVPVCDAPAPAPFAFSLLFTVAMAQQWEAERTEPYIEKLLSVGPKCIDAHFSLALSYLPRWGGGPEDYARYAARVAALVDEEDSDGLYARFALAQWRLHPPDQLFVGTGLDYERTKRGLLHLAKTAPDGKFAASYGAWFSFYLKDDEGLKTFSAELKDDNLQLVWPDDILRFQNVTQAVEKEIAAIKQPAVDKRLENERHR